MFNFIIGYLFNNLIKTYIIYIFFNEVFNNKIKNKRYFLLTYFIYFLSVSLVYLRFNIPIITLLFNIIFIFLITLSYETSFQKRVYFIIMIFIIFMSIESLIMLLDKDNNINLLFNNDNIYAPIYKNIIAQVISFLIVKLLLRFKNINYVNIKVEKYNIFFTLIAILTIPIVIVMFSSNKLNNLEKFIYTLSILLINIVSLSMYDKLIELFNENLKNNYLKIQSDYYKKNIDVLISNLKKTNALKHDIKNHLLIIKSLIHKKEIFKLEEYIDSLTSDLSFYYDSINTGNVIIDSILNCKRYEMEIKNIYNEINIDIPKSLNNIGNSDIIIILGNLIDNAIEANIKLPEESRKIILDIIYDKGIIDISIKNNYNGEINYKNNEILSTKGNFFTHGIGMKNIEEVVKKYNGNLKIDFNENVFSVNLILFT